MGRLLKNNKGSVGILCGLVLLMMTLTASTLLKQKISSLSKNSAQLLNEEAGFYGSELAALAAIASNSSPTPPKDGVYPFTLSSNVELSTSTESALPPIVPPTTAQLKASLALAAFETMPSPKVAALGLVPIPTATAPQDSVPANLAPNVNGTNIPLTNKYTGDNISVTHETLIANRKDRFCGQMTLPGKETPAKTCIVASQSATPQCQEQENNEEVTFQNLTYANKIESHLYIPYLLNQAIKDRGLKYSGIKLNHAILRSFGNEGTGATWTKKGNSDSASPDTALMTEYCNILGFKEYVSSACRDAERSGNYPHGKCNYDSPHDNSLQVPYNDAAGNRVFKRIGSGPQFKKTWLITLTCKRRVVCQ